MNWMVRHPSVRRSMSTVWHSVDPSRTSWRRPLEICRRNRCRYRRNKLWGKLSGRELDIVFFGLCSEETFCLVTVALALAVLLVRVLDVDLFIHEELLVHALNSTIGSFERVVRDEAEAFGNAGFVARNLRRRC